MSPDRRHAVAIFACIALVGLGAGTVYALEIEQTHEYTPHEYSVADVAYDEQHDVVWSIDGNLTAESVSFVGYDVAEETTIVEKSFPSGQALAVGDGVVYIAANHDLWAYNVSADNASVLTEMEDGAGDMAYDEARDLVWIGSAGDVVAFDAETGEEVMRHGEHGDRGVESISVAGDYVASVSTWEPDVVVYDVENDEVAFEPLPESIAEKDDGNLISVHLTGTGELIVGGGWNSVFMYDVESQELLTSYQAHAFGASEVRYHESSETIISTGAGNSVAFFDVGSDSIVETYQHDDTIYAADLDTANDVLWFGDGEGAPGTITGLDLTFESAASPTATATATASPTEAMTETATEETATPVDGETDVEASPTPTATATSGDDETESDASTDPTDTPTETAASSPGFGFLAGLVGVLGLGLLLARRRV